MARPDTVVLRDKPPFRNVQITGFTGGRLVFRGVSRELLRKPLREVARFRIDRYPMLGNAEALLDIDAEAAIPAYRQALDEVAEPWLKHLIRLRLLDVLDRAGRFEAAVALYIELAREDTTCLEDLLPRDAPPAGSAENRRALASLRAALEENTSRDARTFLRTLTLELLLLEGVEPLPEGYEPPAVRPVDAASRPAAPTSQEAGEPPLLFGPSFGKAGDGAPADRERDLRHPPLHLPSDSLVLVAARRAFEEGAATQAADLLERSLPYVPSEQADPWRLLLGRCRIALGRFAPAADDLLALAEATADPDLAAEALYHVAVAHEGMARADVAAGIYRELLERPDSPPAIRRLAREGLKRIGE